ncbi:MAG TPA: glycoside hydrolase family 2 TIM barrel-domain containing protein [Acidobacteriaceae bacterium]|jgi:beta-galactosidase
MNQVTRRQFLAGAAGVAATTLATGKPLSAAIARGVAQSATGEPTRRTLSEGWQLFQGPLGGPWQVWHSEELATFAPVAMPHSFNAYDGCDPDVPYYRGQGWYRTRLQIANPFQNGRTLLHFLGSGQVTSVFVGEQHIVTHEGGYDEWVADITDAAAAWLASAKDTDKAKGVPLSICCDNSRSNERIPSDFSDFSLYGGLYRSVALVYVPAISIANLRLPMEVRLDRWAHVGVFASVYNPSGMTGQVTLNVKVTTPSGKLVQNFSHYSELGTTEISFGDFEVPSREFEYWSPAAPNLYKCEFTLETAAGTHTIKQNLGIRHYEFVEHGPFKLNGERLLLRGTHRHEDHAGFANAMPDDLIREELKLIKAMGANFIRLGHYQQNRLVLELCDELGILVWEELAWCRSGVGNDHWKQMCREKLTNMITQHGNHPSVILWGLGNEDDWPTEFPSIDKEAIRAWMTEMRDLAHKLDPSRLTSFRRCDFARDIPDVYSPSIWAGWYSGLFTEYEASLTKERERVKRMLHIEWGADSLAGRHSEDPYTGLHITTGQGTDERGLAYKATGGPPRISRDGDWSESYACDLFDWHLKTQEALPWLTGAAQWIFKDFTTPLRVENPIPRINMKGLITRDMVRKESYYVFQSYWAEEPMVHIYGHTWPVRWGAPDESKTVKVYSNCDEVELFHGAKSLGVKKRNSQDFPAAGLRWTLPFAAGKNELRAVGRKNSRAVEDRIDFAYETRRWGKPASFTMKQERGLDAANNRYTVHVQLQDAAGIPCLDSRLRVRFSVAGPAKLTDNQGTPWGSREVELANGRGSIEVTLHGSSAEVAVAGKDVPAAYVRLGTPDA